ncbi:MAG TPA: hypothetical protein H9902_13360 [Candidatus Stackebrandtia faecavium]|nr:hypothetical protein [Candidatus Stackebrandtia faecavium]
MDELLVVAMIYGALGVVALLVWLFAIAIFGTAITAGVDKATRWFKTSRGQGDDESESDHDSINDTDALRAMMREEPREPAETEPPLAASS